MAQRLMRAGHQVVGYDPADSARASLEQKGARSAASLQQLVATLEAPRVVWLMVPAGAITDGTITGLLPLLAPGDTIIDGGQFELPRYSATRGGGGAERDSLCRFRDQRRRMGPRRRL